MKIGERLRKKREALNLTQDEMAMVCQCSMNLIEILENDGITHPAIASRIAVQYGLDIDEYNSIVSEDRQRKTLPRPKQPPKDSRSRWYA